VIKMTSKGLEEWTEMKGVKLNDFEFEYFSYILFNLISKNQLYKSSVFRVMYLKGISYLPKYHRDFIRQISHLSGNITRILKKEGNTQQIRHKLFRKLKNYIVPEKVKNHNFSDNFLNLLQANSKTPNEFIIRWTRLGA